MEIEDIQFQSNKQEIEDPLRHTTNPEMQNKLDDLPICELSRLHKLPPSITGVGTGSHNSAQGYT